MTTEDLLSIKLPVRKMSGDFFRVVESQEQIATNSLVDQLEEQFLLEDLLEDSKPPLLDREMASLHYLLFTPFRYPPLQYGSRFGSRFEPSILYASITLETALAETAYYRFLFLSGVSSPFISDKLTTEHTVFMSDYKTGYGLALDEVPFTPFLNLLTDPLDYGRCQSFGSRMRSEGIQAFQYTSARDKAGGANLGIFNADALLSKKPKSKEQCFCELTPIAVSFSFQRQRQFYTFAIEDFLINALLPSPAN